MTNAHERIEDILQVWQQHLTNKDDVVRYCSRQECFTGLSSTNLLASIIGEVVAAIANDYKDALRVGVALHGFDYFLRALDMHVGNAVNSHTRSGFDKDRAWQMLKAAETAGSKLGQLDQYRTENPLVIEYLGATPELLAFSGVTKWCTAMVRILLYVQANGFLRSYCTQEAESAA